MTQIRTIVRALERVTEEAVKKITLDVTANLIDTTPVDTGWARANWIPSIGVPLDRDLEDIPATPANAAGAAALQGAGTALVSASYTLDQGAVFVSNNVPYIVFLNFGSSRQAPAGFVQRAVAKAITVDFRGFSP